jgi:cytochrome c
MKRFTLATAFTALAMPAFSEAHVSGDAEAGQALFNRQCVACHVVKNDAGETLAGRSARTGPNLFGVAGRVPGTVEGFRYSRAVVDYGATGIVWSEENLAAYIQDPTGYLRDTLEDRRARSKMAYKVREEQEALDIYAFLVSIGGNAN